MSILESKVNQRSDTFQQNKQDMLAMLAQLEDLHAEVEAGGGEDHAVARHRAGDVGEAEHFVRHLPPFFPVRRVVGVEPVSGRGDDFDPNL